MARVSTICSFGVVILFAAFVLQFITSISLPFLTSLNIVNVKFKGDHHPSISEVSGPVSELRLGIWAYCGDADNTKDNTCIHTGHAYSLGVDGPENGQVANIRSSWTRGLAVHPVATGVTFIALLLALSNHLTILLIASFLSFLAAVITLIAFAIDIALFVLTKNSVDNLSGIDANTDFGPGFWLTLVSFILLLLSGLTVCFHRRRRSRSAIATTTTTEKRPFWRRWKRNAA